MSRTPGEGNGFAGSNVEAVDERSQRIAARLEWPLLLAALLVVPTIAIEESSLGQPWDNIAAALNWLIWLAFLGEVVIMLSVVPDRRRWLREHPLDLAIVIFTPPFLPASLQAARAFRLLRLLRLFKVARHARTLFSLDGLRYVAVLALLTVLGGGAAFAAVEKAQRLSAWDGVWWAITTVTTVGYGDTYPQTDAGKVIAIVVMFAGIGFVALLTAAAAQRFIASTVEQAEEELAAEIAPPQHEVLRRLDDISERLKRLEARDQPNA